jgi:electron transfer flavoprotein beta subunit
MLQKSPSSSKEYAKRFQGEHLKILVCVKQVPDSGETLKINESTGWIEYGPLTVFRMNRFDEFALEEALLMKERMPGTIVHALSLGPERVRTTIKRAMETGADHGIHIFDPGERYLSPFASASFIASYARGKGYDLIFTGVMAEDDMACQVGQTVAALLDLPCVTSVINERAGSGSNELFVEREIEGGSRQSLAVTLPAVLTIQSGINFPRYPSLSNVLRARSQEQEIIDTGDINVSPVQEAMVSLREPYRAMEGTFIKGTQQEKARKLAAIFHEKALL